VCRPNTSTSGERAPSFKVIGSLCVGLGVDAIEFFRPDVRDRGEKAVPLLSAQITGSVQRLSATDAEMVLALARRLGRK